MWELGDIVMTIFSLDSNTRIPDTVVADSMTFATVKLVVGADLYTKFRQASFSISPVGKFSNDSSNITVPIGIVKTAYTKVFSNQIGWAHITAVVGNIVTVDSVYFAQSIDTITLTATNLVDTADNYSYATIVARTANIIPLRKSQAITFYSNRGTFANGQNTFTTNLMIDSVDTNHMYYVAQAYLKDNRVETAAVSASISNVVTNVTAVYI